MTELDINRHPFYQAFVVLLAMICLLLGMIVSVVWFVKMLIVLLVLMATVMALTKNNVKKVRCNGEQWQVLWQNHHDWQTVDLLASQFWGEQCLYLCFGAHETAKQISFSLFKTQKNAKQFHQYQIYLLKHWRKNSIDKPGFELK